MQEITIGWNKETDELTASPDVTLNDENGRNLRVAADGLPDIVDGLQVDWEGYCPFSRVAAGVSKEPSDSRFTFCDWIGFPGRPHGKFKFTVRAFDVNGELLSELDPGGGEEPPPPNNNWP